MITIQIGNSFSTVKNTTTLQLRELRKSLSYETDHSAAYFSGGYVRTAHLLDKYGRFPTGLMDRLIETCCENNYEIQLEDLRAKPKLGTAGLNLRLKVQPYEDQIKASDVAVSMERAGIVMPTGTGKSLLAALIIAKLNVKTLVVVPNIEIKTQLLESFTDLFGSTSNITVENIDSKALLRKQEYDCLIIDEAHHVAAKTYQNLNKKFWGNIYYRFFLTATFFRNQESEQMLFESIAGKRCYRLTFAEAIKKKYIVPVEAYFITVPPIKIKGTKWPAVYKEAVTNNETRNNIISKIIRSLREADKHCLCLVKEITHGEALSSLSDTPFASGQTEGSRKLIKDFKDGKIKCLIGTAGIMGEGVDTKPCEYVLIAGLGKAKSAFQQQVGRAVRNFDNKNSAKIILFKDNSHKWTLSHFKAQAKILIDEYNSFLQELNYID